MSKTTIHRKKFSEKFFNALDLSKVIQLLPPAKKNAISYKDKLKCWVFMFIWGFPTKNCCHKADFGKQAYKDTLGFENI